MERNSLVFIIVCLVFYLGYSQYLNSKYPNRLNPRNEPASEVATSDERSQPQISAPSELTEEKLAQPSADATPTANIPLLSESELTIENSDVIYKFDQYGGGLKTVILKNFTAEDHTSQMQLINTPMILTPLMSKNVNPRKLLVAQRNGNTISFEQTYNNWIINHSYTVAETGFGLITEFSWENKSDTHQSLETSVFMEKTVDYAVQSKGLLGILPGMPTEHPQSIIGIQGTVERADIQKYCEDSTKVTPLLAQENANLDFFGIDKHYFLIALVPQVKKSSFEITKNGHSTSTSCSLRFINRVNQGEIAPGQKVNVTYKGWFGPKSDKEMEAFSPGLSNSLDFGFFSAVGQILLTVLRWVYLLVGNWGVAIIIFTILLKFLFYPLTRQAHVSMSKMKLLQPQMNKIREKYKDDPRQQQQELMKFMATHKVNPMKGCLPILPQIPVFFAFYRVLSSSVELRHAPFIGWISDLSAADPYFITPILLTLGMFLQQKLTPTTGMDKTQERIMMMLPVMFGFMMISLPAGLVLYMLTNTMVSIGQQQWLNRRLA